MGIITINIDFEKLWGEPEPTISFDNSVYELTTEEGSDAAVKFSVINGDNEDVTDDCEIALNNSDISVEKREDGSYFVVAADKAVGEYTTAATATYAYKSAIVKAYAVINTVVESGVKYLTFEALENCTFSVSIPTNVSSTVTSISYSLDDGESWTECVPSASAYTTPTVQAGDKVLWKGTATALGYSYGNGTTFSSTGRFDVSGNIMSLLYGDDLADKKSLSASNAFRELFKNATKLVNATNLVLPATTLADSCYYGIFNGCTSLTTAPELPATTLADSCYMEMFRSCTSLTSAPELPVTTLVSYCYNCMFWGCTSLTSAPELSAITLKSACYQAMFSGCKKLNSITMLATDISASNCLNSWVEGVAATGTFVKNAEATWDVSGVNGIPTGWTVQTA